MVRPKGLLWSFRRTVPLTTRKQHVEDSFLSLRLQYSTLGRSDALCHRLTDIRYLRLLDVLHYRTDIHSPPRMVVDVSIAVFLCIWVDYYGIRQSNLSHPSILTVKLGDRA